MGAKVKVLTEAPRRKEKKEKKKEERKKRAVRKGEEVENVGEVSFKVNKNRLIDIRVKCEF